MAKTIITNERNHNAPAPGTLYEHEDGRYRVAKSPELADFARSDLGWHRVGPVDVSSLREATHD